MTFEEALHYLENNTDIFKIQYIRQDGKSGKWSVLACKCNEHLDPVDCMFKVEVIHDWDTAEDNIVDVLHKIIISTQEAFQMAEENPPQTGLEN